MATQLGKFVRPQSRYLVPRPRLFERLDEAAWGQGIWLNAPAGAGKTSLIGTWIEARGLETLWYDLDAGDDDPATFFHYLGQALRLCSPEAPGLPELTPDYRGNLERYSLRCFETLIAAMPQPFVVVLDNYQRLAPDAALHPLIGQLLGLLPPQGLLVVISRAAVVPALSRWLATASLALIGGEELRLNAEEAAELAARQPGMEIETQQLDTILAATNGWAAGVLLMLRAGPSGLGGVAEAGFELVFEYLAAEVFGKAPEPLQAFLLDTALLPSMTVAMAETLTGEAEAGRYLGDLGRANFFIECRAGAEGRIYQYHPLFRAFLLQRLAQTRSPERLRALRLAAAGLLIEVRRAEAAFELYQQLGDSEAMLGLIRSEAPGLLASGRNQQLDAWISQLPASVQTAQPWARFWRAQAWLPFRPGEARTQLIAAHQGFEASNEVVGELLSAASILQSLYFEWSSFVDADPWIEALERRAEAIGQLPLELQARIVAAAGAGLHKRAPAHPLAGRWAIQALEMARAGGPPNLRLALASYALVHAIWRGAFREGETIIAEFDELSRGPGLPPVLRLQWLMFVAFLSWLVGRYQDAHHAVQSGLDLARDTGVKVMDFLLHIQDLHAAMGEGDAAAAETALAGMQRALDTRRQLDLHHFHFARARLRALAGDCTVVTDMGHSLAQMTALGNLVLSDALRVQYAQMLALCGRLEAARHEVDAAQAQVRGMGCRVLDYECDLVVAYIALQAGQQQAAVAALRNGLAIAASEGYVNVPAYWNRSIIARLYATALEAGIEVDHVCRVIRGAGLAPPDDAPECWPWKVRVHTLGGFRLHVDGVLQEPTGKAQTRTLDLLKALVAQEGLGASAVQLAALLWPDAEADTARNSLNTGLHRLRNLLGGRETLILSDGRLSLDPRWVWLDLWRCEAALNGLREQLRGGPETVDELMAMAERLWGCCPGPFLAGEEAAWALPARERVRARAEWLLLGIGRRLEALSAEEAIAYYRQALGRDLLNEGLHQGLLRSLRTTGRDAEALAAWQRCQGLLTEALGCAPSAATRALVADLITSD